MNSYNVVKALVRFAWGVVALIVISYVSCAQAATLNEISALRALIPDCHIKIKDTRTVFIWCAKANQIAECWIVRATVPLSTLHTLGYELGQISVAQPSANLTERQCYEQLPQ